MNWTIITEVQKQLKSGRVRNSYKIQCGCGETRFIHKSEWQHILANTTKSNISPDGCRKCSFSKRNQERQIQKAYKNLYSNLKSSCKRRNILNNLTFEESVQIYKSNCYYCNSSPSNNFKSSAMGTTPVLYNGIDRIDPKQGYTTDNTVSCCFPCNRAKSDLSVEQFYGLIERIYSFRVQRLSEASE